MLLRLSIRNYALIHKLDIEFGEPFTVITGETGAGKSIILGALALILGQRAENLSFPDPSSKCLIEGSFDISQSDLGDFFAENDLDYDNPCIIRREINPQGKSRSFINDTPAGLNLLKDLTSRLVDVHSQHQTLLLQDSHFQLSVIDAVAGNNDLLKVYRTKYRLLKEEEKSFAELSIRNKEAQAEEDYLRFLFDELEKARLQAGEREALINESGMLSHAEEIKTRLFNALMLLSEGEENILRKVNEVYALLQGAARHHQEAAALSERLSACAIELKDLSFAVGHLQEVTNFNPARLEEVDERLNLLYALEQKHHVRSTDELIEKKEEIGNRLLKIANLDQELVRAESRIKELKEELGILAFRLREKRTALIPAIEAAVIETITSLGMKDARFRVELTELEEPGKFGSDKVRFLFSANKGVEPDEVSRIASGGELSRLMLAVKSLISASNLLPTIIFDEIDNGISGDIASRTGDILKRMAGKMQVIAITHLPQIAGKSNEHFKVLKVDENGRTYSSIEKLSPEERISELALMISGDSALEAARATAKELLRNN